MTAALVAAVALAFVAAPPPARVQVAATEHQRGDSGPAQAGA